MRAFQMSPLVFALAIAWVPGPTSAAPPKGVKPPTTTISPTTTDTEVNFTVQGTFTAQRRPRVAVLKFDDTNSWAIGENFDDSVEAMLVTFLKRKSQFVVLDRISLGGLFEEKSRIVRGQIATEADDPAQRELLERIDLYILGSVTLLGKDGRPLTPPTTAVGAGALNLPPLFTPGPPLGPAAEGRSSGLSTGSSGGLHIEVDARLFSRFDGRIIAAAQRSGPLSCLRSIVERLGVALEQEFLKPYYGDLKIQLDQPERVRVLLTPILMNDALDEEKPPIELGATVTIGAETDRVEAWVMDPTSYTIRNVLSGWYSLRLERPGYQAEGLDSARWEARRGSQKGDIEIIDRKTGRPLSTTDAALSRFVVQVDPLSTRTLDLNPHRFKFTKNVGALAPKVKRQYLDQGFTWKPQRVLLFGSTGLELNTSPAPREFADDGSCDLFDERPPAPPPYGQTLVAAGESFQVGDFSGGELVIEDYQEGTLVPAGEYKMYLWEPNYTLTEATVRVRHADRGQSTPIVINRATSPVQLSNTGTQENGVATLRGRETGYTFRESLSFEQPKLIPRLPVDTYETRSDLAGLERWHALTQLRTEPQLNTPPVWDPESSVDAPVLKPQAEKRVKAPPVVGVTVKTRMVIAGRSEILTDLHQIKSSDAFVDRRLSQALFRLLHGEPGKRPERGLHKKPGFLSRLFGKVELDLHHTDDNVSVRVPLSFERPKPVEELSQDLPGGPLPQKREELFELLLQRLHLVDLLLLDADDMDALRSVPDVADAIREYLAAGGSLFAFANQVGSYESILGVPFAIEKTSKATVKFRLAPGDIAENILPSEKKLNQTRVKRQRELPEFGREPLDRHWWSIAFTKGHRDPRIIEIGRRERGGYIALWLDDSRSFRSDSGASAPIVEEVRRRVEDRVFDWARYLMYKRYDQSGELVKRAEAALGR